MTLQILGASPKIKSLGIADVINEAYIDYTPKTSIGTQTDDATPVTFTDVRGVSASALGITSVDDIQTITMSATGGSFAIRYKGQTTATMAFNISTATMQTNLQALSTIGSGNVTVTGTAGASYAITAAGSLAATLLDDFEIVNGGQGSPVLTGGGAIITHTRYGGHRLYNSDSTSTTNSSIYRYTQMTNNVTFMSIEFDFGTAGSTNNGCVNVASIAAITPNTAGVISAGTVADVPCHANFFRDRLEFGIVQSGVLVTIFSYTYDTIFPATTYQYAEVAIDRYSASICLRAPDQTVWSISHAVIGSTTARYAWHETISANSTTDFEPLIAKFSVDSAPVRMHLSGGVSRTQSLITDGRAAARNYMPVGTLQILDQTFSTRRAKFDLNANASTAGQVSTLGVTYRSGIINTKVATQTAQVAYSTSTAEVQLVGATLGTNELDFMGAGAVYRFYIAGGISWIATSGALTFRVYLGATAAAQTIVMLTQASAGGTFAQPIPFHLEAYAQIRTTGSGGTYIAWGRGMAWTSATAVVNFLPASGSGLATTAAVNTTAATPVAKLTSQFATSSANNGIKVEVATIERPM